MRDAQSSWWSGRRPNLSRWYKRLTSSYNTTSREELPLIRPVLAKLLAIHMMHCDFAWYHRKYKHDDVVLDSSEPFTDGTKNTRTQHTKDV